MACATAMEQARSFVRDYHLHVVAALARLEHSTAIGSLALELVAGFYNFGELGWASVVLREGLPKSATHCAIFIRPRDRTRLLGHRSRGTSPASA